MAEREREEAVTGKKQRHAWLWSWSPQEGSVADRRGYYTQEGEPGARATALEGRPTLATPMKAESQSRNARHPHRPQDTREQDLQPGAPTSPASRKVCARSS